MDKNSMNYWFPKIEKLNIPIPRTRMVAVPEELRKAISELDESKIYGMLKKHSLNYIKEAIAELGGYPVFIRTDQLSAKHSWKDSCFVQKEDELPKHLFELIETSICADMFGIDVASFVVREYIPMKNLFTAFHGDMPVNPEVRFFVNNGEVLCWHWYWIEEAIHNPSIDNWKEVLNREKESISGNELLWLEKDAKKVAEALEGDGFWSVDFCKAKDGRFILIDLAEGEKSWHPRDCPIYKKMPNIDKQFINKAEQNIQIKE